MTPKQICARYKELDEKRARRLASAYDVFDEIRALQRVCMHPNLLHTPTGDICPDCKWSSR